MKTIFKLAFVALLGSTLIGCKTTQIREYSDNINESSYMLNEGVRMVQDARTFCEMIPVIGDSCRESRHEAEASEAYHQGMLKRRISEDNQDIYTREAVSKHNRDKMITDAEQRNIYLGNKKLGHQGLYLDPVYDQHGVTPNYQKAGREAATVDSIYTQQGSGKAELRRSNGPDGCFIYYADGSTGSC